MGCWKGVSLAICNLGGVRPWDSLRSPAPMGVAAPLLVPSCLECASWSGLPGVPLSTSGTPHIPLYAGLGAGDPEAGPGFSWAGRSSLQAHRCNGSSGVQQPSPPSPQIAQLEGNRTWLPAPSCVQSPSLLPGAATWERRQSCHRGCPPQPGIGSFFSLL